MMAIKALGVYKKDGSARAKIEYMLDQAVPSKADYYLKETDGVGEPAGRWFGRAAQTIGLEGAVAPNQLHGIMQGFDPRTYDPESSENVKLLRQAGPNRRTGWDCTFTAQKSVSWAYATETPERRELIRKVFNEAVDKALKRMEQDMMTRRGDRGSEVEKVEGCFFSVFEHCTARVPDMKDKTGLEHLQHLMNGTADPHLHAHAIVSNTCLRKDGSYGTITNESFHESQKLLGAMFRAEMCKGLREKLGYQIREGKSGMFEIEGVDEKTIERYSKRNVIIMEWVKVHAEELARKGLTGKAAEAYAWARTRSSKESVNRPALFKEWQKDASSIGFDVGSLTRQNKTQEKSEFDLKSVLARVANGQSVFDISRLEAELWVERQFHDFDVKDMLRKTFDSGEIILLKDKTGKLFGVSKEIREMEMTIARETVRLRNSVAQRTRSEKAIPVILDFADKQREKAKKGGYVFDEKIWEKQRAAIEELTMKTGRIAQLKGFAGAGKTTVMTCVREIYEAEGMRVIGCALAGKAAENLESEALIKSNTVQGLLARIEHGYEKLSYQHVVVVDEAGMVDTKLMHDLVKACSESGAKLITLGEAEQLQPIGAGGPFRLIEKVLSGAAEKNGGAGIQILDSITRQDASRGYGWLTKAVLDVRSGNAEAALDVLAEKGLYKVEKDQDAAIKSMVNDWFGAVYKSDAQDGKFKKLGQKVEYDKKLMIAGTRHEVSVLNALARDMRRQHGELKSKDVPVRIKDGKDGAIVVKNFAVGDRIVFGKKDKELGGKNSEGKSGVQNGYYGEILSIRQTVFGKCAVMEVKLDDGRVIKFDTSKKITLTSLDQMMDGKFIDFEQYNDIDHAYAITVHKSQGQTVENCFVMASDTMTDREWSYVALSRSKGETKLYATEDQSEDLADKMNRSRMKGTSLDYEAVDMAKFRTGQEGSVDIEALLDEGAKTRYKGKIENLTQAIAWGNGDDVRRMLADPKQKALLDQADERGNTPLHLAVFKKNPEAVKALLAAGAVVDVGNRMGITALHDAVRAGDPEVVRMLVERGADPFRISKSGDCPFKLASDLERRSAEVIEQTVNQRANLTR